MTKHGNHVPRTATKEKHTARRKRVRMQSKPLLIQATRKAKPFYDSDRRELRVGTIVVKCFTQESDAQEIILASFQEERWRRSIDDPLPVKDYQDAKKRLRRAVDNLNRRQRVSLIHFQVIHQGTGVAWELLEGSDGRETVERRKRGT